MTSMHVICGLGHPQSKILATAMVTTGWLPSVAVTFDVIGNSMLGCFLA